MVWDNLVAHDFKVDPLGPENLLVIAPGPLTGLYLPSSGKCSFISLSPSTGVYGDSSMGGSFGAELRQSGLDVLSITGRAEQLSVLLIDNGENKILPMPELEGKSCLETEGLVKEALGSHEINVATIGPAGENLVRFACVNADWSRNAGRTGIGAVMGSKNLKAIAVRGAKDLPVHDLNGLIAEAEKAYAYMRNHKFFDLWQREGLMNVMEYANAAGILPSYNFKDASFSRIAQINGDTMLDSYKIGDSACFACPMCCGNICLVKQGKYIGTVVEGPEYETCAMLGSNLGIDNFAAVLHAAQACDEYGIDTISAGNLIGAAIEGYEKGILSLKDLDGRPIAWGDEEAILELIRKIALREGIGDILADGSLRVIETWPEMDKLILQVKGLEQSAYDSRAGASMALAYATSDIGAHHTRAWTIAKEIELGKDWSNEEKVELVIYHQTLRPLFDMLGVCRLPWIELGLNEQHYERFYSSVTGEPATLPELLEKSNRIYDLTRLINTRLGMSRADDTMPHKVHSAPVQTGPTAGQVIDKKDFERLLDLYYQKRGWDSNGIPAAGLEKQYS
jgi:aldehyde:ferredoxin oxidoreductase